MPQIGMGGVPQVRVGVVGRAMQLVGNHTHFRAIQEIIVHVTVKLHSASPRAITLLLLVQLFSNCTQMCVITYTNCTSKVFK